MGRVRNSEGRTVRPENEEDDEEEEEARNGIESQTVGTNEREGETAEFNRRQ